MSDNANVDDYCLKTVITMDSAIDLIKYCVFIFTNLNPILLQNNVKVKNGHLTLSGHVELTSLY